MVFDGLGHVVERRLQEKFPVEDSFPVGKKVWREEHWDPQSGRILFWRSSRRLSLFGIKYQEEIQIPSWQIWDTEVVPGIAGVLKAWIRLIAQIALFFSY